ncbi:MAG: type 4a pilus biogenesis protein PilO [Vicinamibacterales bacterium]
MAINLSLSKLSWQAQLAAFVGLSLAGAGVFWNFYAVSAREAIDARRQELSTTRAEVDKGLATARRLPQFREDVARLQTDLDRLRAVLPEEKDVADLLRRIQGMATQSNLTIRGFTPRPVTTQQLHAEWPIGLQLEGNYHDLGGFLERVSKFPRIINVNGINIKARDQQGSATINAECTATTFVLVDAVRPAAPAGAPPAPAPPPSN